MRTYSADCGAGLKGWGINTPCREQPSSNNWQDLCVNTLALFLLRMGFPPASECHCETELQVPTVLTCLAIYFPRPPFLSVSFFHLPPRISSSQINCLLLHSCLRICFRRTHTESHWLLRAFLGRWNRQMSLPGSTTALVLTLAQHSSHCVLFPTETQTLHWDKLKWMGHV